MLAGIPVGMKGVEEVREVFDIAAVTPLHCGLHLDLCLARGLDYYTGAIIEVKSADVPMGSICGGGRYDDLTAIFGLNDVSGVGISFGADRIYDVMETLSRFPDTTGTFQPGAGHQLRGKRTQLLFAGAGKPAFYRGAVRNVSGTCKNQKAVSVCRQEPHSVCPDGW